MSGLTTEHLTWAKGFVGFDIADTASDTSAEDAPANGANTTNGAPLRAKGYAEKFEKKGKGKAAGPGEAASTEAAPAPNDKDLAAKLKALNDEMAALKKVGFDTAQMKSNADDLAKHGVKAEAETDAGKREKALQAVRSRADEEIEHAQALSKSLKEVMGKSKGNPSEAQKSDIYKKALKEHYGLQIEIPPDFKNTHLDRVFDMFGSVPKGDAKQDKLKKLKYDKSVNGGDYDEDNLTIDMGDFKGAKGEEDYELDGKKLPTNSFNVTTLHEIGHSVDTKHHLMDTNQAKPGCGHWVSQTLGKVTDAFVAELKNTVSLSNKVTDPMLKNVVMTALKAGTTVQIAVIDNDDWQKILPFLVSKCLPCRDKSKPYESNSPVVVGGSTVYVESSENEWWSYSSGARGQTRVNDYQWRSPGEWFAEIYAITWLKKHKPPSAVDAAIAEHCWK